MADWRDWLVMAEKSLQSAGPLREIDPRSSASRYYYAAYQAMSALLLYADPRLNPPEDREVWNHSDTPLLIVNHLISVVPRLDSRKDMQRRLQLLYKIRVSADYVSLDNVGDKLDEVRKNAEFLVKVAVGITAGSRAK